MQLTTRTNQTTSIKMTPQEKAKELIEKFNVLAWGNTAYTRLRRKKECAMIVVGEVINGNFGEGYNHFWNEVKIEIAKYK